ncbi:MAG TPA: DNA-binding response regulator [Lachnospiraceae bacterium]|nr:DNA-binding response regulator [Lachnospiraceae bacterium]
MAVTEREKGRKMQYTVLVVDDEEEIREGIIRKIDWEQHGFKIIGSAGNGNDALEIAESLQPDVVMTDIMMPFMDGLELGERIVRMNPDVKLLVFSGADEFDYAKRALRIRAVEYILKPIGAEELIATLVKIKRDLDEAYDSRRNLATLREHYIDSIPVIREQTIAALVEGRMDKEQLEKKSGIAQIDLDAWGYTVGLLEIEPGQRTATKKLFPNHDEALIPVTLKQIADEALPAYAKVSTFYYGDMVGAVVCLYREEDIFRLIEGMNRVCQIMQKVYRVKVTGGIGMVCGNALELRTARKEAQTALSYRVAFGSGQTVYLGDVEPQKISALQFSESGEELLDAIRLGDEDAVRAQVKGVFGRLQSQTPNNSQLEVYFIEIKIAFMRLLQAYGLVSGRLWEAIEGFHVVDSIHSLEDAERWLAEKSLAVSRAIREARSHSLSMITARAREYMLENYGDETLSVEKASNILHVSPNYFSTLFKKEIQVSFVAYLTEVRMKKAVEFLNTTDEKSYIIAARVGYSDPNYFSHVFKKHFGVSPQRYRKGGSTAS